jgi:hypothetical protein
LLFGKDCTEEIQRRHVQSTKTCKHLAAKLDCRFCTSKLLSLKKTKLGIQKLEEMKHTQSDQLQGQLSRALIVVAKSDIFQMRGMVCAGTNQLSSSNPILLSTSGGT